MRNPPVRFGGRAGQLNARSYPIGRAGNPSMRPVAALPPIAHNDRCIPRDLPPAFRQELARFCRIGPKQPPMTSPSAQPLSGRRIAVTRAREQASELAGKLAALGAK